MSCPDISSAILEPQLDLTSARLRGIVEAKHLLPVRVNAPE